MADILRIARKEFRGFFASPAAFLFLGAFLAATLFVFFWVETFFARNIADLRPLFRWLPALLIFLVAALTMRAWSEERRGGTLESLLTSPTRPLILILGKFCAALALVALALLLTLPLPLTVAVLGPLDWGPVIGSYVATLFLAAAYIAIGLYMSGRTDNPIVALILTAVVCGLFYLVGSPSLTRLFGHEVGAVLAALGAGSRFESIARGVIDLRDLYYYVSIAGVFLCLNLYSLERLRWAGNPTSRPHRQWGWLTTLVAANFIAANFWLAPLHWARVDITADRAYSLSAVTKDYLAQLEEPLLIRGYFSSQTHPLLAPLVPQLKDLLSEYAIAAGGKARVEFIDPHQDREAEEEAASRYGIRPVPFQMTSRHQAGVVNSYFDILIAYGDEYETLGYRDLIELRSQSETELDVALRNPEYAITRAIRKVVETYRTGGNPFDSLQSPVVFRGYVSADARLPEELRTLRAELETVLDELKQRAGDKLQVAFADPDADEALARELEESYGLTPLIANLFDPEPFWFYMLLEHEGTLVPVPFPENLDRDGLERALLASVRRLAPGFLKTVAVVKPSAFAPGGKRYDQLQARLEESVRVHETDLRDGKVSEETDLLLVLAPDGLDDRQLFAIDQFLMRGGSVVLATSPFDVRVDGSLTAMKHSSGLEEWLRHHGLEIEEQLVLDPQNAALPVPVQRFIGGLMVQEYHMLPYPHFPDVRGSGLNDTHPITAGLDQLTLNWASPIRVDADKNGERQVARLLSSSPQSWASDSLSLVPDYQAHPATGFAAPPERGPQLLAVALEGRFQSFFRDKEPPLPEAGEDGTDKETAFAGIIERSPESARLVLIASNTFASDIAMAMASQGIGTSYTKPVEFLQNAIDWALEDSALLALRGRAQFARTLVPLTDEGRQFWETLNYLLALAGLGLVWLWRWQVRRADQARYQQILAEV
ncbi:MAG: ABC transporter permease subunit [Xanthomonadaceae bacterium]|nr:ABC transporter permease subunit [Xanthomonadaceae bacterium]